MKNLTILILLLSISFISHSQDREKKFAVYAMTEPGAYDNGFNIGAGIEYQMNLMYFGAQVFTFPNLNGVTYNHVIATIGFNYHNKWNEYRIFAGLRGGPIVRKDCPSALMGFEVGFDYNIPRSNLYVGANAGRDLRTDGMATSSRPNETKNHYENNVSIRFGFKW